jgi:hypothetical protein
MDPYHVAVAVARNCPDWHDGKAKTTAFKGVKRNTSMYMLK